MSLKATTDFQTEFEKLPEAQKNDQGNVQELWGKIRDAQINQVSHFDDDIREQLITDLDGTMSSGYNEYVQDYEEKQKVQSVSTGLYNTQPEALGSYLKFVTSPDAPDDTRVSKEQVASMLSDYVKNYPENSKYLIESSKALELDPAFTGALQVSADKLEAENDYEFQYKLSKAVSDLDLKAFDVLRDGEEANGYKREAAKSLAGKRASIETLIAQRDAKALEDSRKKLEDTRWLNKGVLAFTQENFSGQGYTGDEEKRIGQAVKQRYVATYGQHDGMLRYLQKSGSNGYVDPEVNDIIKKGGVSITGVLNSDEEVPEAMTKALYYQGLLDSMGDGAFNLYGSLQSRSNLKVIDALTSTGKPLYAAVSDVYTADSELLKGDSAVNYNRRKIQRAVDSVIREDGTWLKSKSPNSPQVYPLAEQLFKRNYAITKDAELSVKLMKDTLDESFFDNRGFPVNKFELRYVTPENEVIQVTPEVFKEHTALMAYAVEQQFPDESWAADDLTLMPVGDGTFLMVDSSTDYMLARDSKGNPIQFTLKDIQEGKGKFDYLARSRE